MTVKRSADVRGTSRATTRSVKEKPKTTSARDSRRLTSRPRHRNRGSPRKSCSGKCSRIMGTPMSIDRDLRDAGRRKRVEDPEPHGRRPNRLEAEDPARPDGFSLGDRFPRAARERVDGETLDALTEGDGFLHAKDLDVR